MFQSLEIHLTAVFGSPCAPEQLRMYPHIQMKTESMTCRKSPLGEVILQEFDALDGYIYTLEVDSSSSIEIPIEIRMRDLHVLYNLKSRSELQLVYQERQSPCILKSKRARFFYLPPNTYQLCIPKGKTYLFGFYFQPKLFRQNNERPFAYLHSLIHAHRKGQEQAIASIDFMIGPKTRNRIDWLLKRVRTGDFDSEDYVQQTQMALIKLSKEKVYDEYERTSDPKELITRCRIRISHQVENTNHPIVLKNIAKQLRVSYAYLCRLHQKYYGTTLLAYTDELKLEKIKTLLQQPWSLLEISAQCSFNSPSALVRFFKRKMTITPDQYRKNQ